MTNFIHHHISILVVRLCSLAWRGVLKEFSMPAATLKPFTLSAGILFNRNNNVVIYRFIAAYISKLAP
ncbi:MAG: hypothetical protein ABN478_09375 [Mixta sp.]